MTIAAEASMIVGAYLSEIYNHKSGKTSPKSKTKIIDDD